MIAFLLDMAWKSSLVAAAGMSIANLLRAHVSGKVDVLRLAFCMLLVLPALSLWGPGFAFEILLAAGPRLAGPAGAAAPAGALLSLDAIVGALYLAGLLMVVGRCASGLWMLRRWSRTASDVLAPGWTAALARVKKGDARLQGLRLRVSDHVSAPLSWGLSDPVVLIDRQTLARPDQADAILAHEAAHVVRADWVALMLMKAVAGLFWFNPLVWLMKRTVDQYAEEAADMTATRAVDPADYAQVLLDCARRCGKPAPVANSMASGPQRLLRRVRAVLERAERIRPDGGRTGLALAVCALVCTPVALLRAEPALSRESSRPEPPPLTAPMTVQSAEAVAERRRIEGLALAAQGRALAAEGRAMAEKGRAYAARRREPPP